MLSCVQWYLAYELNDLAPSLACDVVKLRATSERCFKSAQDMSTSFLDPRGPEGSGLVSGVGFD